ncbi:hypothetical protein B296_00024140 [Ensete ventricosum]|uniref:Uncharacterized protein n=1 Tax=Ensete ventricosum TaxID=4639 RepID=A0A426YD95_ENSVE|nr:hypothetical protein B296_00024140 [Ensete ventricosum]
MKKHNSYKILSKFEIQLIFRALSQKFKILDIPNVLAHRKSYDHSFVKKYDDHRLCAKSRFDRFSRTVSKIHNTSHSQYITLREVI